MKGNKYSSQRTDDNLIFPRLTQIRKYSNQELFDEQMLTLNATWLRRHPLYSVYYIMVTTTWNQLFWILSNSQWIEISEDFVWKQEASEYFFCVGWKLPGDESHPDCGSHDSKFPHLQRNPQVILIYDFLSYRLSRYLNSHNPKIPLFYRNSQVKVPHVKTNPQVIIIAEKKL